MSVIYKELFYKALRIRMVEERIIDIYPTDKIESPVHLSIGQEPHIVAIMDRLSELDRVFTTYRSHAVYLAKGGCMKGMFAELFGKQGGISKGKAGSMHLAAPSVGMFGSSAIVGAVYSHAIGHAYSQSFFGRAAVTICVTGEGATEEGTFYESLNFAVLKRLPVIFIIENNDLAINIPQKVRQAYSIKKLAKALGADYFYLQDGFDFMDVYKQSHSIVESVRNGAGPAVVEIRTFRFKEHVGIADEYGKPHRCNTSFEAWLARDPLIIEKELIAEFENKIKKEIDDAVAFAEKSEPSNIGELLKDVL